MRWAASMTISFRSLALLVPLAAGCTQIAPEDLEIPGPTSTVFDGLDAIAVGGDASGVLITPEGAELLATPEGALLRQPTWSRDGRRVASIDLGNAPRVRVFDVVEETSTSVDARRNYFFFSWSGDGSAIAALGPGPVGTTLDILRPDGTPLSAGSLDAGSFYLAWEPNGDDLLVHRDGELELVRDVADLATREPLGAPGQSFLAPAWVPGTRDALIVADREGDARLIRIDVDTASKRDLGPVAGSAGIVVSPDGSRALLAHGMSGPGPGAEIDIANPVQDSSAPTELIDLESGERTLVSALPTFWAEWSPDGERLALLHVSAEQGFEWVVWTDDVSEPLGSWLPSPVFFRDYVFFSWQFVESPRVRSPQSDAIVYAGIDEAGETGIYIHRVGDGAATRISDGDVAFWTPG